MEQRYDPEVKSLVFRVPGVRALRLPLKMPAPSNPFSSALLLIYGFAGIILLGTIFLIFPVSSTGGHFTSPITALFSATSAACVTGLVVVDTGTYWSTFGQAVLLALFQIGGFGFITGATVILLAIGGRFGLRERLAVSESMGLERTGGILGIVIKIAIFSLIIEAAGAVIFYIRWLVVGEPGVSLWTAIFHAVSAFNNCGMDLFGNFNSMSAFRGDFPVIITTVALTLLGSTGYVVIMEYTRKKHFFKLSLDSKLVLFSTLVLLILGTLFYLIAEYSSPVTLGPLSFPQKLLVAFFQSVTPRTAGFSAINIGGLQQITLFFTMILMFIGGAAGSAAGGVKVNTVGILVLTVISVFRDRQGIEAFRRQITRLTVFRALAVVTSYLVVAGLIITILSVTETFPIEKIMFETFSALSTVGLSTGITPDLSIIGKFIITLSMFIGRLGPLVLMAYLVRRQRTVDIDYPQENIRIG